MFIKKNQIFIKCIHATNFYLIISNNKNIIKGKNIIKKKYNNKNFKKLCMST